MKVGVIGDKIDTTKGYEMILDKSAIKTLRTGDIVKVNSSTNGDVYCRMISMYFKKNQYLSWLNPIFINAVMPLPRDKVETVPDNEISEVYGISKKGIHIGNIRHYPDLKVRIGFEKKLPMAILGKTGSGKSQTAMVVLEEMMKKNQTAIVLDYHRDYLSLGDLHPDKTVVFQPTKLEESFNAQRHIAENKVMIIDLDSVGDEYMKKSYVQFMIAHLFEHARRNPTDIVLFIDEAHNFVPQGKKSSTKGEVIRVASEGRKFGFTVCLITQRPARIDKSALEQCDLVIIHKLTGRNDLRAVMDGVEGVANSDKNNIQRLDVGEAILVGSNIREPVYTKIKWRGKKKRK